MRPSKEPSLRQLDPRLRDLQRRAGLRADPWITRGPQVRTSAGLLLCTATDEPLARYLRDLHTLFLPTLNQLVYQLRGAEDLEPKEKSIA